MNLTSPFLWTTEVASTSLLVYKMLNVSVKIGLNSKWQKIPQSSGLNKIEIYFSFAKVQEIRTGLDQCFAIHWHGLFQVTSLFKMAAKAPVIFQPKARKGREKKEMYLFFKDPPFCTTSACILISWNLVTWPYLTARGSGKCGLNYEANIQGYCS